MAIYEVVDLTRGGTIADRVKVADTELSRMIGLLGRRGLTAGEGLWIRPSSGVHTIGMKFAIDVIGLDRDLRVIKLWRDLVPYRITSVSLALRSVVELPAGVIHSSGVQLGNSLRISRVVLEPALT